jgi:hypothetical protein
MAKRAVSFEEAVSTVSRLTPLEKVRLMEKLASMLESEISASTVESRESAEDSGAKKMTFQELAVWLNENPPTEPWGDLKDDEDAGDYVHRMRRQGTIWLDEPGEEK